MGTTRQRGRAANRPSRKNTSPLGRLVSTLAAAVLLGGAFLLFLEGGRELVPGRCPTGLFSPSTEGVSGETKQLLEDPNFEATPAAARDLRAGVVDSRLVATLQTVAEEHRVCVVAFKEGHRFLPGVEDGPLIPEGYGEAGGLLNTHYYGRAADIREVNGESIRNNGNDPDVLSIGEALAGLPPDQRPDQIIGPPDWTETLDPSREEGWILDEDQLELHKDHLHIGYRSEGSTSNTR